MYLSKNQPLDEQSVLRIFVQVCIGLAYMHKESVVHRDIKLKNLFVFKDGLVR